MKIGIMGFGVVGGGLGELIAANADSIKRRSGEEVTIAKILDLRDFPDSEYDCFTKDFNDILNDPEIGVVAEVMGGTKPAYEFTKQLLMAGKSVVSSNKELVAKHGTELLKIAKEKNANYLFEASVGGGIPIIRPLYTSLAANELTDIYGILNGTTNYILTQMIKEGATFEDALKGAQENGYAEKDPTADIEGHDTCRKTAILASLAFGKFVDSDKIPCEGITKITLEDVEYADKFDSVIKLLGISTRAENGVYAMVCPAMIEKEHPLAGIDDVFNGIMVRGDGLGDVMFYGRGAGALPTASAVLSDIIDIVKHRDKHIRLGWSNGSSDYLLDSKTLKSRFYVRLSKEDSNETAENLFAKKGFDVITLDGLKYKDEFAIITPEITEYEFEKLLKEDGKFADFDVLGKIRLVAG